MGLVEEAESKKLARGPGGVGAFSGLSLGQAALLQSLPRVLQFLEGTETFPKPSRLPLSYSASMRLSTAGKKGGQAAAVVHRAKLSWCS